MERSRLRIKFSLQCVSGLLPRSGLITCALPKQRSYLSQSDRSLLNQEVPHKQSIDTRGVKAAHRIARRANQWIAEQIERRIVEHRQPGRLARGVQQLPVQGVVLLRDRMDADQA